MCPVNGHAQPAGWEAGGEEGPWSWEMCVFQVAGLISAGVVMIAIVALGKLLEPLQKVTLLLSTLIA